MTMRQDDKDKLLVKLKTSLSWT